MASTAMVALICIRLRLPGQLVQVPVVELLPRKSSQPVSLMTSPRNAVELTLSSHECIHAVDFSPENYHAVNQLRREFFAPGAPRDISLTELKLWHADAVDHNWRSQYLNDMPDFLAGYFGHRYETLLASGKSGRRRANTFLRNTIGKSVLPRLKNVTHQWQKDYSHGMPSPFKDSLDNLPTYGRDQIRDLSYSVANYLAETFNAWTEETAPKKAPDKHESRTAYC